MKNYERIFGVEGLSSVQKSSYAKSKVKPDNFMQLFWISAGVSNCAKLFLLCQGSGQILN